MKHIPSIYFHILALELADVPFWEPAPIAEISEVAANSGVCIKPEDAIELERFRPDAEGLKVRIDKFGVFSDSGIPFAIYKAVRTRDGVREEYSWLCRLENGVVSLERTFAVVRK